MKVLSIRNPWAWLVVHGLKDVENRNWSTVFRGRFAVHAGRAFDYQGYQWVQRKFPEIKMPTPTEFDFMAVIGTVDLVDCVTCCESPWFFGRYGFVLRNPRPCVPIHLAGQRRFFDVPLDRRIFVQ